MDASLGGTTGAGRERSPRRGWIIAALLALGMLASLRWTVHPWYDAENDASMYILTARSLAAGEGYSMLDQPFTIRPPGFSVLIAPLIRWRGTDFQALNLFVGLWGVAGVLLLFAFARARIGDVLAFLLALAIWINPGYQRLCNQTLSDVPGFALLFALLWMERWAERAPTPRRCLILGIAVGASAYVRSGLLLLLPAVALAWLCAKPRQSWGLWNRVLAVLCLGVGVCLVQLPWSFRNRAADTRRAVDQTLLHSYSTAMWHVDMGDPNSPRLAASEILGRFLKRGPSILGVLGSRMGEGAQGWKPLVTAVALLLSGLAMLWLRRSPSEFFVCLNLVVIAFYFGFASRLILPVYALLLLSAIEALGVVFKSAARLISERTASGGVVAAVLVWIAIDWAPRQDWEGIANKHRVYEDITNRFQEHLAPENVLASYRGWHYSVYLHRPVFSLEFVVERAKRLDAAEAFIDKHEIDTVLLAASKDARPYVEYFESRYGAEAPDPLARVYRVRSGD